MKKIICTLINFATLLNLAGCKETPSSELMLAQSDLFQVEIKDAVIIAQHHFVNQSANARTASDDNVRVIASTETIRDSAGNALMYIICFTDKTELKDNPSNRGFVIVSADKRVIPILAKSDSGSINLNDDNPGLKVWTSYVSNAIITGRKQRIKPSEGVVALWAKYDENHLKLRNAKTTDCTDPPCPDAPCPVDYFYQSPILTTTTWRQVPPYSMYCPSSSSNDCAPCGQASAGCAAVAIAQIFNIYKKPATYTIPPAGPVNYVYPLAKSVTTYNCTSANVRDKEIAALIRSAGMWANTNYAFYKCNSFTWREDIKNAFASAGYSNSGKRVSWLSNYQTVNSEIKTGHPVIMDATIGFVQFNDWHIWVIDGYQQYITYHKADPANPFSSCLSAEYAYYHMNWGWQP